jgi:hypothetical protein
MTAARALLAAKPSIMAQMADTARMGREAAERNRAAEIQAGTPRTFVVRAVRVA